ncbi:MAG: MarR family winged helix-turn-helix transcriptional regulator [Gemmatimonadaceae bacterium]
MKSAASARKRRTRGKGVKRLDAADHIHSAAIRVLRGLRRQDDKWGLSAPRLSALSVVVFGGPITLGDLARAEQVRPPTMTRLVQALESARLVTRTADSGDARIIWIKATPKGRKLLFKGRAARVRALSTRLASFSSEEVESLDAAANLLLRVASGL